MAQLEDISAKYAEELATLILSPPDDSSPAREFVERMPNDMPNLFRVLTKIGEKYENYAVANLDPYGNIKIGRVAYALI